MIGRRIGGLIDRMRPGLAKGFLIGAPISIALWAVAFYIIARAM